MLENESFNSGFKYILRIMDCSTKFAWCFPCKNKTALQVFNYLENLFNNCYITKELHTDKGHKFRNNYISTLCNSYNI